YVSGADDQQSVMGPYLGYKFAGVIHKNPPSTKFGLRRGFSYASNELLPYYSFGRYDYDEDQASKFKRAIKTALKLNGNKEGLRFLDKSQTYALKIPLIR